MERCVATATGAGGTRRAGSNGEIVDEDVIEVVLLGKEDILADFIQVEVESRQRRQIHLY